MRAGASRRRLGLLAVLGCVLALVVMQMRAGSAFGDTGPAYTASTYADSFTDNGTFGPLGVAFDSSGDLYATDAPNDSVYKFPAGCSTPCHADSSTLLHQFSSGPIGIAVAGDGQLYVADGAGSIDELDPNSGSVLRTAASGLCVSWVEALAVDPISGDLFFDDTCDGDIWRISNPGNGSNLTPTVYASGIAYPQYGMYFSPDGTLWVEGGGNTYMVSGTDTANPGTVTDLGISISGGDGAVAAKNPTNPGQPPYLMVNSTDGHIYKVDLSWSSSGAPTATVETANTVFYNGTYGAFETVGNDGCLYATQQNTVIQVINADRSCSLAPTVQALTTAKTADQPSVSAGASDGYTITISNPNSTAATLSDITDTLPAGFSYTTGSSSGVTLEDPTISGQSLDWSGSFTVPAGGKISLHFDVTVSSSVGTFYNNAGGRSATFSVTPTGDTAPVTISAATKTLSVVRTGSGSGSVSSGDGQIDCGSTCSAQYNNGTQVTLTATAASGSTFSGWLVDGSSSACPGTGTCTVTMSSDHTVTATFTLLTRTLTVRKAGSGSGSVSSNPAGITCGSVCQKSYPQDTQVTLTATAASGSTFAGWLVDGSSSACPGTGTCTVTMSSDHTVTATFTTPPPPARWRIVATPSPSDGGRLRAISCPASRACIAVGWSGSSSSRVALAERWQDGRWQEQTTALLPDAFRQQSVFDDVSCSSASACTAVGGQNASSGVLAERWNGARWEAQKVASAGIGAVLVAVSCPSSRLCFALGTYSGGVIAERWTSSEGWLRIKPPVNPAGGAISGQTLRLTCPTASTCVAVGSYRTGQQTLAEVWHDSAWKLEPTPDPAGGQNNELTGISCASTSACTAVGSSYYSHSGRFHGFVERLENGQWMLTDNSQGTPQLNAVSCVESSDCEAVGYYTRVGVGPTIYPPFAEVGGPTWTPQSTETPSASAFNYLDGVSCISRLWCMAVGYSDAAGQHTLAERYH